MIILHDYQKSSVLLLTICDQSRAVGLVCMDVSL